MRIMFMGTPVFAKIALEAIYNAGTDEIVCVVTGQDKPQGRGYKLTPPPVRQYAESVGLTVYQPQKLTDNETLIKLSEYSPDVIIVAAYGKLLPEAVLKLPPLGCINIHASLLPSHRGAAPLNRALMNGDKVGGVTIMKMEAGIDTGEMYLKHEIAITPQMNAGEYHDLAAAAGAAAILEALDLLRRGVLKGEPQNDALATYAKKITDGDKKIDFNQSAEHIYNQIRGLSPYPAAYFYLKSQRIKALTAKITKEVGACGEIISLEEGIGIACGGGAIIITELQPEGKTKMTAGEYLKGNKLKMGDVADVF